MQIIKRNGLREEFDICKITGAIRKANKNVLIEYRLSDLDILGIGLKILKEYRDTGYTPTVEEIQDLVEIYLMETAPMVAKEYITYRYKRQLARDRYQDLMYAVGEKLQCTNIENQNANVDEKSFGGRIGEATDIMMRQYALDFCMSKTSKKNHLENRIYIHDLNHYAVGDHNCLSIPFDDLLAKGFKTRQTDVRPANSINTAMQLVAVIFQLQSLNQYGGVSATHLDWTMVPYVRKSFYKHYKDGLKFVCQYPQEFIDNETYTTANIGDISINDDNAYADKDAWNYALKMTIKETYQAVEALYHNLNTLQSRSGNQLPFTSINYGTCTLPEGRLITQALLEVSLEGLGDKHRTSIFPCGIFQCMKGVNREPGDPNYDLYRLALKSTAERLYPNYANVDWSGNAGYDRNDPCTYFSTMGCRTANGWDVNGLGQRKDGRGNICPTTIILPTIAMEAVEICKNSETEEEKAAEIFMKLLDVAINDAKDSLIERFDWVCSQNADAAKFMYENNVMAGYIPEEGIRSALKHGTLAVGMLGMAETLQILVGCNHCAPKGMELAKRICKLYKDKCTKFKEEYKLNFGVYYTPKDQWAA